MPVFDLKHASILMKDGYRDVGAVNNALGYATGISVVAIDGVAVAPPIGSTVTFTGDPQRYLISASSTISITFSPPLEVALTDNEVMTVGGRQISVKMGDGTITWDSTRNRDYILNRGIIDEVRDGNQSPVDVSLDAQFQFVTGHSSDPSGGLPTIEDVLDKTGLANSWLSSDLADPCRPYCIDLEVFYEPICTTVRGEAILLQYFRYEKLSYDTKAGTIKATGKCNIRNAIATRFAQA